MYLLCDTVCGGGVQEGTVLLALLSAGFQSLPLVPTIKLGPSDTDSWVGGFLYVLRPCGVSAMKSPVRLGFLPLLPHSPPPKCFQSEALRLYFPVLESWVAQSIQLPRCSPRFICSGMWDLPVHQLPPWGETDTQLSVSAPPTGLDEYFFFNSLVVGLPYSMIFCQFWLFFVFKFVVVLLLVVQGGTVCLPTPPSWPEVMGFFLEF